MKQGRVFIITMVTVIAVGGVCSSQTAGQQTHWETVEPERKLTQAGNEFGFDLFRELNKTDTSINLLVSPLSVSAALAMTYNGAAGETKTAMENTLQLAGWEINDINRTYKSLFATLQQLGRQIQMEIANSIWYRQSLPVKDSFLAVNTEYYDAKIQALDFNDSQAAGIINDWVSEKTHGKIPNIIDRIDPLLQMLLINAVYLKGSWAKPFAEGDTKLEPFYRFDGQKIQCQLMTQDGRFPYWSDGNLQVVDLGLGSPGFGVLIILPANRTDLDTLVTSINGTFWAKLVDRPTSAYGRIFVPKFEFQYEAGLKKYLDVLGMSKCFAPGADFGGISDAPLFIDDVLHKTYVKTDEKGVEAAAVTAVLMLGDAPDSKPKLEFTMRVDRPFLFVIHERTSGAILFLGKVLDPTAG